MKYFLEATRRGELESVKRYVEHILLQKDKPLEGDGRFQAAFFEDPESLSGYIEHLLHNVKPVCRPDCFNESLYKTIKQDNVKITEYLLDMKVGGSELPMEYAIRARATGVLEMLFHRSWDISASLQNKDRPPALE